MKFFMLIQLRIYILFILFVFEGCKPHNHTSNFSQASDTINLSNFESTHFWDEIIIDKIIPLETKENSVIGLIHQMDIFENFIIIHDLFNHNIFIFDIDGKFLKKIGKRGNGPGEYKDIRGYTIDPKKQEILILTYKKILKYSLPDGVFLGSQKITIPEDYCDPFRLLKVGEDEFIFWNSNSPVLNDISRQQYVLYTVKNMKITDKQVILKDYKTLMPQFTGNGSEHYILPQPTSYSILKIRDKLVLEAFYLNFGKYSLPREISTKPLLEKEVNEFYKSKYFKAIDSFFNSDKCIYLTCTGPNSKAFEFLYDKLTKTSKARIKLGVSPTILSIDDNGWFYGVLESNDIITGNYKKAHNPEIIFTEINKIKGILRIESNPVIIKFKPHE
ncbi:MAG: 6-bladed beta-propeller [Bacteroidetes bacterium]|nr:MAG: 6-bladed beta-propeller [Bacteroidota bacterium]